MSFATSKALDPPCMDRGCGDNVSRQLGAEKRALLSKTSPSNYNRTPKKEIPISAELQKCRKASSLNDLSPRSETDSKVRRRRPIQMPSPKLKIIDSCNVPIEQICLQTIPNTNLAAKQVCHLLVLNAWRHRRNDVQQLTVTIQHLGTQTIVLRRLLDSEKERVAHANSDVQQMLLQVGESVREKSALKANLKNDYIAARSEVTVLETQLGKERDKLTKLREDKKHLIEKVHTNEELVTTKNSTIERLQTKCKEMEYKLSSESEQCKKAKSESMDAKKAMKELQEKHKKLEEDLKSVSEKSTQLSMKVEALENILASREQQNNTLLKTIQDQQIEIRALQVRHSELQNTWRSRAFEIATMFARIPLSILQNMAFIFLPQNN
ncbi:hypothetical protein C0J52_22542 [Blattella germanica]|nr:hypothetical protein C0J52_22542 [Blattella germanica]